MNRLRILRIAFHLEADDNQTLNALGLDNPFEADYDGAPEEHPERHPEGHPCYAPCRTIRIEMFTLS